jgi:hypothetical protein
MYLDSGEVGYSLPNSTKDTIEFRNGQAYHVQRVKKITFDGDSGEQWAIRPLTNQTTVIAFYIDISPEIIGQNISGITFNSQFINLASSSLNTSETEAISNYAFWASNSRIVIAINRSRLTTQDVEGFKTWLASNPQDIYYQLATPIETPISVIGNAMAYPNGTFLIEDVVRRSGVYSSGITVDKAISQLDNIYKLNDDGSSTKLAVSGATVAGDGLSFTHTSLSNGDFVWFDYFYQGTNVKGLTTIYYYGDKMIVADTTTGTVYKIIFTIDNGVITVDKVAV